MNKTYGALLAFSFLAAIGAFNILMGATRLKKKRSAAWMAKLRIAMGTLMIISAVAIYFYFKSQGAL